MDELEPIPSGFAAPPPPPDPPAGAGRGITRPLRRVLAGVLGAALVIGLVAVLVRDSAPSADDQLAEIRAFLAEAETARFEVDLDMEFGGGGGEEDDALGQQVTARLRGVGEIVMPDRSHYVLDAGQGASEAIVVDDGVYYRDADSKEELEGETWYFEDSADAVGDTGFAGGPQFLYDFSGSSSALGVEPATLRRILDRLHDPERVGDRVIRATLTLEEAFAESAEDLEGTTGTLTVELTAAGGGRLERLVWTVDGGYEPADEEDASYVEEYLSVFRYQADIAYSGWGDAVTITEPDEADVDDYDDGSPSYDGSYNEVTDADLDDLAAYATAALVAPSTLPAGFVLIDAYIDDSAEDGCPTVELSYQDPVAMEAWYDTDDGVAPPDLNITLTSEACGEEVFLPVGDDFVAGSHSGQITRSDDVDLLEGEHPYNDVYLVVAGTAVHVHSDLPEPDLVAAVASLAPVTVRTLGDAREAAGK